MKFARAKREHIVCKSVAQSHAHHSVGNCNPVSNDTFNLSVYCCDYSNNKILSSSSSSSTSKFDTFFLTPQTVFSRSLLCHISSRLPFNCSSEKVKFVPHAVPNANPFYCKCKNDAYHTQCCRIVFGCRHSSISIHLPCCAQHCTTVQHIDFAKHTRTQKKSGIKSDNFTTPIIFCAITPYTFYNPL